MSELVKLRELCHARSGDKGDIANIGVIVYQKAHYEWVKKYVTVDVVMRYLKPIASGPVERYELPGIGALNFVVHGALDGGGSRSRAINAYGKGYSSIMLEMEIPRPRNAVRDQQPA